MLISNGIEYAGIIPTPFIERETNLTRTDVTCSSVIALMAV